MSRGGPAGALGSAGPQAGGTTTTALITTGAARPVSALGFSGRSAIYDPDLLDSGQLSELDPPDVNAIVADPMPSIQGYSSTVDGRYAAVTGSHQATGEGQNTLAPSAVANGTLDQLGTSVLLTPAEYLVTSSAGDGPAAGPAGTGRRAVPAARPERYLVPGQHAGDSQGRGAGRQRPGGTRPPGFSSGSPRRTAPRAGSARRRRRPRASESP